VHMLADLLCHLGAEPSRCGMPAHDALALHTASLAAPSQPVQGSPILYLSWQRLNHGYWNFYCIVG
jgi:hypothetical protein